MTIRWQRDGQETKGKAELTLGWPSLQTRRKHPLQGQESSWMCWCLNQILFALWVCPHPCSSEHWLQSAPSCLLQDLLWAEASALSRSLQPRVPTGTACSQWLTDRGVWNAASRVRTTLVIQWLRLLAFNAQGPGLIPGQGSRSRMPQ